MHLIGDTARPCTSWSANQRALQTMWTRCFGCRLVGRSHPHGATLTKQRRLLSRDNAKRASRVSCRCVQRTHIDRFLASPAVVVAGLVPATPSTARKQIRVAGTGPATTNEPFNPTRIRSSFVPRADAKPSRTPLSSSARLPGSGTRASRRAPGIVQSWPCRRPRASRLPHSEPAVCAGFARRFRPRGSR